MARAADGEHKVLEWIPDAVVVSDRDGRIVFVNRRAEEMTGYRRRELVGQKVELLVPDAGGVNRRGRSRRKSDDGGIEARLMGAAGGDYRMVRKDGTEQPVDIALGPAGDADDPHTIVVLRDVSERRRMELALEHRALHDPLTDLANRTLFFDRLRQSILSARRESRLVALVMLDLDDFKRVNDDLGHSTGDEVLRKLAVRLHEGLRATDTAARIGGDEFAWILPRVSGAAAVERTVRKHLLAVQRPVTLRSRRRISVGISAGIAMYPDDGRDVDTLMRHADAALYSAKREDRGLIFYR